jgi:hypothetical protein
MPEGFLTGLHRSWFAWSGWLFTVGGTVFGLAVSGAYAWIGALCAVAGLLALTALAYERHRDLREAERRHAADLNRLERDVRTAQERAEQAERRLNEIPADILRQLQQVVRQYAFADLATTLADHADYVARMVNLQQALGKPITLRTFVKRGGGLYVDARMVQPSMAYLRQDDPFLLEFKNPGGLVTASALLRIHQLDGAKELIWFRVIEYAGEEMAHLDALADKQEVSGKGYSARPICDVSQYASVNLADIADFIRRLADEVVRNRV